MAINTGGPGEQKLESPTCNVQKVMVVEKDVRPLKSLQFGGGGTPQVVPTAHGGIARGEGGQVVLMCTYIHM